MNFIVSANTDIGLSKTVNQDSVLVRILNTKQGRMVLAVLCDGMGGHSKGEFASACVVKAFADWSVSGLGALCEGPLEDSAIRSHWERIVQTEHERLCAYGASQNAKIGTTVVAMLLTQTRYYILNVGDSRAYELRNGIRQITKDHTLVAHRVSIGQMSEEEARVSPERSVLIQGIGASQFVNPDMFFGDVLPNAVYMLCCDGFRHEITPDEIYSMLRPELLFDDFRMSQNSLALIELNKQRQERDNISVALVRTF